MAEYTAITPDGKYLLHYGVKGMKWGKKRPRLGNYKIGTHPNNPALDQRRNFDAWEKTKANSRTGASTQYSSYGWFNKDAEESNLSKAQEKRTSSAPDEKDKRIRKNKSQSPTKKGSSDKTPSESTAKKGGPKETKSRKGRLKVESNAPETKAKKKKKTGASSKRSDIASSKKR